MHGLITGARNRRAFLNPLFAYPVIWSLVLLMYQLSWSRIYAPLNGGLLAFFVATIVLSALIGLVLQRWLNSRPSRVSKLARPPLTRILTAVTVLGLVADFVYEGHVPLFDAVTPGGFGYGDFKGIPVIHVLVVTFSLFYAAVLAHAWTRGTGRARHALLGQVLLIAALHLLMLSRQAVMFILLMLALLFLSSARLTVRRVVATCALALLAAYVFGGIGNMRYGGSFFDNSYIAELAKASDSFPSWIPGQFLWAYIYLVSPLGNLNGVVTGLHPQDNWAGAVTNWVPDFLAKRLFPEFDPSTPLVVDYFNVSTGFAGASKFYGFAGLGLTFALLVAAVIGVVLLVRGPLDQPTWAILSGLVLFMFFNNAFSFSGLSFALAYPILISLLYEVKRLRVRRSLGRARQTTSSDVD